MGVLNHSVDLAFSRLPVTAGPISYFVIRRDPIGIYLRKGSPKAAWPAAGRAANIPPCRSPSWTGIPLPAGQRPSHPEGDGGCAAEYNVKPSNIIDVKNMPYMFQVANTGTYNCLYAKPIPDVNPDNFYWIEDCDITYDLAILYDKNSDRRAEIEELCQIMYRYYEMNPDLL